MGSNSPNILLTEPTPFDPSVSGAWASILNTNFSLIDSAVWGIGTIALPPQPGYPTVVLSSNAGAPDQSRAQHFIFTGVLTAATTVLWPLSLTRTFSVANNTTGAFALTLGVNNGSGSPAGTTQVIAQGQTVQFISDGTNITVRGSLAQGTAGGDLSGTYPSPTVAKIQGNPVNPAVPTNGQVLTWVQANLDWEPQTPASGVSGPVSSTGGFVPVWNGTGGNALGAGLQVGAVANGLLQLDANGNLPAVGGAAVTGLIVPQNIQSANYTTVASDSGKHILHPTADTTARTFTIDSNLFVPYAIGTTISFVNQHGAGVLTITCNDSMFFAGSGATGPRSLAANGIATALKITATEWLISGTGLS